MFGAIGFFVAAFSAILFVTSFNRAFSLHDRSTNNFLEYGFFGLSAALVIWALACIINTPNFTVQAILAGEILLAGASIAMLNIIIKLGAAGNALVTFIMAMAFVYRQTHLAVTAYVSNGLLHFNMQGELKIVILAVFIIIWLAALLLTVRSFSATFPNLAAAKYIIGVYFTCLVLAIAWFLSTRNNIMIEAQFGLIVILFLLGVVFNSKLKSARTTDATLPITNPAPPTRPTSPAVLLPSPPRPQPPRPQSPAPLSPPRPVLRPRQEGHAIHRPPVRKIQ